MRRRLGIAMVGMVTAALILSGLGTMVLAAVSDRAAAEDDLRQQVDGTSALLSELTIVSRDGEGETVRQRLQTVLQTISVEGIGVLILPRSGAQPIGELPTGVTLEDLDLPALESGETVSHSDGDLIWAAKAATNRSGVRQILVITREPDPILIPAFRWFLIAGGITIAIALVVSRNLSDRLTRPIRDARNTASAIAHGDLSARAPTTDTHDEVGELVESINTMADNLDRSRQLERHFLLSVGHDLRTPLTSIRGYAEALTDGAVTDPKAVGGIIETEAKRLDRLVGDLLLLARLESTGFEYAMIRTDLASLVDAAAFGLQPEAEAKGVNLNRQTSHTVSSVEVDPDRMAQVVGNLVGNALRFADHTVGVTVWEELGRVHVAVGDDGPGIDEADLPHVFERLYVAESSPKAQESGSGLGLAIVRELVEGMAGTVTARRSAMGGAEFVVSFPPAR